MTTWESGGILLILSVRWDALPPGKLNCVRNERPSGWTSQTVWTILKDKNFMTPLRI